MLELQESFNLPSPIQQLKHGLFEKAGVSVWIKRDDLIHPQVSGNKWRKLIYNIKSYKNSTHRQLLTFGGAYSNHLYATAAAGNIFNIPTVGVVRGEELKADNDTLQFCERCGMKLHFISRDQYRRKNDPEFIKTLIKEFENPLIIPEGGSNYLAVKGTAEIVDEIDLDFDFITCSVGTGGTIAGITSALQVGQKAIGFSSLKGGAFLEKDVRKLLRVDEHATLPMNIITDYHFGGYAKSNQVLLAFIENFRSDFSIDLDVVYTGKMFYGLFDLIDRNYFPKGSKIIAVHTGGIQH
jgi:1-aminocyclopropane-1-carboxylate deaminase/D-cysteine desulfhydrase-like pyridoxal-dependent ACC family enzyme